jgi:PPP family 3-phenylpropionic acid transporter
VVYANYGQRVYYVMAAMALIAATVMWLARHRLAAFSSEVGAGSR